MTCNDHRTEKKINQNWTHQWIIPKNSVQGTDIQIIHHTQSFHILIQSCLFELLHFLLSVTKSLRWWHVRTRSLSPAMNHPHISHLQWHSLWQEQTVKQKAETVQRRAAEFVQLVMWSKESSPRGQFDVLIVKMLRKPRTEEMNEKHRLPVLASISHLWNWEQAGRTCSEDTPHICSWNLLSLCHSFYGPQAAAHRNVREIKSA